MEDACGFHEGIHCWSDDMRKFDLLAERVRLTTEVGDAALIEVKLVHTGNDGLLSIVEAARDATQQELHRLNELLWEREDNLDG